MRSGEMKSFISKLLGTLKIGPQSAMDPDEKADLKEQMNTGEDYNDFMS